MIRLVFLLRRKPGMTLGEFQRYWRETHAPLVAGLATALNIRRYVQVHTIEDPANAAMGAARGGMEPIYDGVAELWWDSEAALQRVLETTAGQTGGAILLEDEGRFIDLANSPLWLNYEYPQVNPTPENLVATGRSSLVKLYFPLRLRADIGFDAGQLYWRTNHGPLIRSQAHGSGIQRYMQVHRFQTPIEAGLRSSRGTQVDSYDGHAEVWFDRGVQRGGPEAQAANRRAIEDEAKFIDFPRSSMWLGKEVAVIDRMGWAD